jgi:hypothetical protein
MGVLLDCLASAFARLCGICHEIIPNWIRRPDETPTRNLSPQNSAKP